MLQPSLCLRVPSQRRLVVLPAGHRLLEPAQLLFDGDEVGGAGEHVLPQGGTALQRRPLVVQRDAGSLLEGKLAALQRRLPGEDA